MATADDPMKLLQRLRGGDASALGPLFALQEEALRRAIAWRLDRRLSARLDVADVVQETYALAVRRLPDYLQGSDMPFPVWLLWLAREQVQAVHRRHLGADARTVGRELPNLPLDSSACLVRGLLAREPSPSKAVAAAEMAERLRQALGQLDDDERDLILWKHFEQLSHREMAGLLGITEAAASKRYIRALERLRGLLLAE